MSLLPIFKKKKKSNKFLVAEIDNNQIKVLALYKESEEKIRIIGSSIKKLQENSIVNYHIIDKDLVILTLKEAVQEATSELEEPIIDIIMGVKGTQCVEITTTAKSTATHKRVIKDKDIKEVYDRIIEAAYIQAQNEIVKIRGDYESELEIIISSNVYNKVDHVFYEDPLGVEGEVLESAVFNAFCFSEDLAIIRKIVSKAGLQLLSIAPIPYSMVQNISKADIEEKTDYTVLNFGEDTTEIMVVFGKGLIDTKTLPIGYSHLREGLGYKMGLTIVEAEKVLETYSQGKLSEVEEDIVQKCLNDILYVWLEGIKLCFEEFSDVKTFANQIYLTGEGTLIPDVINKLKDELWYKEIPFKTIPEYKKIDINDFTFIDDATSKITSPIWIPTQSLGIIYLEIEGQDD